MWICAQKHVHNLWCGDQTKSLCSINHGKLSKERLFLILEVSAYTVYPNSFQDLTLKHAASSVHKSNQVKLFWRNGDIHMEDSMIQEIIELRQLDPYMVVKALVQFIINVTVFWAGATVEQK